METRYYAIAISPTGAECELGRVLEVTREAAITRYFESDFATTEGGWFADGFYLTETLAIETRQKINNEWISGHRVVMDVPSLRQAHERVLNSDRRRGRRTKREMVAEAVTHAR